MKMVYHFRQGKYANTTRAKKQCSLDSFLDQESTGNIMHIAEIHKQMSAYVMIIYKIGYLASEISSSSKDYETTNINSLLTKQM